MMSRSQPDPMQSSTRTGTIWALVATPYPVPAAVEATWVP